MTPSWPTPAPTPAPDWHAPWLADWRLLGESASAAVGQGQPVWAVLNALSAPAPVRFEPAACLGRGVAYEQHVHAHRRVPTRDHWHDFFNGLCWLRFPLAKQRLNDLHAAQLAQSLPGAPRGRVRDAITSLDENGALMAAPDVIWDALGARDWTRLFGPLRDRWGEVRLVLFGHALIEQLITPFKSLTAHVWRVPSEVEGTAALDAWLAADLTAERLAAKPFLPLPVLGVPGWWAANEDPAFYADARVFRPARGAAAQA